MIACHRLISQAAGKLTSRSLREKLYDLRDIARILARQGPRKSNGLFDGRTRVTRGQYEPVFIGSVTYHEPIDDVLHPVALQPNHGWQTTCGDPQISGHFHFSSV